MAFGQTGRGSDFCAGIVRAVWSRFQAVVRSTERMSSAGRTFPGGAAVDFAVCELRVFAGARRIPGLSVGFAVHPKVARFLEPLFLQRNAQADKAGSFLTLGKSAMIFQNLAPRFRPLNNPICATLPFWIAMQLHWKLTSVHCLLNQLIIQDATRLAL